MNQLPYLEATIKETLRRYPPLIQVERRLKEGVTGYKLGEKEEGGSGIPLEAGTSVISCVYSVHNNPQYYPQPERFRPERFLPENKHHLVPYTFLPFGAGPRHCLGMRFAYQEIKLLLAQLLRRFSFGLAEGTPRSLRFNGGSLFLTPQPFQLKVVERLVVEQ